MSKHPWSKYFIVFLITSVVFSTAFMISNYLNSKKIQEVQSIEDKIALDILSSETQYDLLNETSCKNISSAPNPLLSEELNSLAERLAYTEDQRGSDNAEVIRLKKSYSLLEAKDFLLMSKISKKCKTDPAFILYFYSNSGNCPECTRTGYVLTRMREEYPTLRVYSFDYNLDLGTLKTLIQIYHVENKLPAIIIDDNVYYGFKTNDEIEALYPDLQKIKALQTASSSATTTPEKKKATTSTPQ